MDKVEGLKKILVQDPGNDFARYGLAMELIRLGQTEAGLLEFSNLLERDPNYTAAYQMSAQTLATLGRPEEAIKRLKAGIASAERKGNRHAVSEMQGLLDELDR
jgi:predicted Zn-dependent protease